MTTVQKQLFNMADNGYKAFQAGLMPTVDPATVIGVRTPKLRQLAKELKGTPVATDFLARLPHTYYEENNLHGFLIEQEKDYQKVIAELNRFLPYVNNWATCDSIAPKVMGRHLPALERQCRAWLAASHPYTVRYAIGMLLRYFLDEAFDSKFLDWVASVHSEEYYVNMMIAWYFATALAKQPAAALPYITGQRLPPFIHNKAIQKAVESRRIPSAMKEQLQQYRCN